MAKPNCDLWNPGFIELHPAFWPLRPFARDFVLSHAQWPALSGYQAFLDEGLGTIYSANRQPLKFVPQGEKPQGFEQGYEPRIYLRGEIQTRLHNWHDFFQVMVWRIFPDTKITLNKLHFEASKWRLEQTPDKTQRSTRENMLTQFDECGAVILASDADLLTMIKTFQWKPLFWQHRQRLQQHLRCIVFGHAVYEKLLQPYIGLTVNSILIHVEQDLLTQADFTIVNEADTLLADIFTKSDRPRSPQDLHPFPLLGLPGWANNDNESFYDNTRYFRPQRHSKT